MAKRSSRPRRSAQERLVSDVVGQLSRTQQGRKLLLVLAVLALVAFGGWWAWQRYQEHTRPRHPVGPTVRLATWNLRKFSERPGIDLRVVADVIRSSNFDLVAVQEVMKEGQMVDALLNELGPPWRSTRLGERTGNFERFTFIYNGDHLQEVGPAHAVTDPEVVRECARAPYQCSFRAGQFDFTLVSVHLSYEDTRRRRREAYALSGYAPRLAAASDEKDVIVVGDFNEQGRGNLHFFEDQGWSALNRDSTNLGGSEVYDNLLIDPRHTAEWSGRAGAVRFDETMFRGDDRAARDAVSDHRPAYADFATGGPDDD